MDIRDKAGAVPVVSFAGTQGAETVVVKDTTPETTDHVVETEHGVIINGVEYTDLPREDWPSIWNR